MQYRGSGITTPWVRVFICLIAIAFGLLNAVLGGQRTPTRAQVKYHNAVAEAKASGYAPESVPRPPENEMWQRDAPSQTVVGVAVAVVGLLALTEPLWRRRSQSKPVTRNG
jgi:hypothetical protein